MTVTSSAQRWVVWQGVFEKPAMLSIAESIFWPRMTIHIIGMEGRKVHSVRKFGIILCWKKAMESFSLSDLMMERKVIRVMPQCRSPMCLPITMKFWYSTRQIPTSRR
ncbi:hypothetical protein COOONC_21695 [Cooperia oncophora]